MSNINCFAIIILKDVSKNGVLHGYDVFKGIQIIECKSKYDIKALEQALNEDDDIDYKAKFREMEDYKLKFEEMEEDYRRLKEKYDNYIDYNTDDFITITSNTLKSIKLDFISYFHNYIFKHIETDFLNLTNNCYIPFDVDKTILVHLRLDDVSCRSDYNGFECSEYYKNKILNNEPCYREFDDRINNQAPLSKDKLINIINKAKEKYNEYKIILLTSPCSDTSFLDYEVIKNHDENLDLFLLTSCNVTILSRSTYALSSLFFNNLNKKYAYIPLWGHFVCCGLDTIYDKIDKTKITYFY